MDPGDAGPASPPLAAPLGGTGESVSKRSIPTWAKVLAAVVVIATLVGLGYYQFGPNAKHTHTVTGALGLSWTFDAAGQPCQGKGGYSDLTAGASVILRDEHDTILASTTLNQGTGDDVSCKFSFTLTDVPDTAQFYVIEVSHRGQISYSHQKLADAGWVFKLTIGE